MFSKEFEPEYENALKLWDRTFRKINRYEKRITVRRGNTSYMEIDEKYSDLLDRENLLYEKLNEARRKLFGLNKED